MGAAPHGDRGITIPIGSLINGNSAPTWPAHVVAVLCDKRLRSLAHQTDRHPVEIRVTVQDLRRVPGSVEVASWWERGALRPQRETCDV